MTNRFEMIGVQQAKEISEVKRGVDRISDLMIDLTKVNGRMDRLEDRQLAEGKRVDEISKRLWNFDTGQA